MAQIQADRIQETTLVSGLVAAVLLGPTNQMRPFSLVMANADTTWSLIQSTVNGEWECAQGTYVTGGSLTRTWRAGASNSAGTSALLNFSGGLKTVSMVDPSIAKILLDFAGNANIPNGLAFGGFLTRNTRIVAGAGTITMTVNDYGIVVAKTVSAATSLILPPSVPAGREVRIKDGKGDALNYAITITTSDGSLIDGQASYIMNSNYQENGLLYNGTQWNVF